jgi:tetratricopeptide (TPR) repeat protein
MARNRRSGRPGARGRPAPAASSGEGAQSPRRAPFILVALALAAATIAAYAPVWRFDFVALDDPGYVYANPDVANGLGWSSLRWALTTGHEANWHPLTWTSHILDVEAFGLDPGAHHIVNLVLHIVATWLLFVAVRALTGSHWRSAFVAGVFALHPLHVESVAWVSERKDVLSGVFFMLVLWAYARYVRAASRHRYVLVAAALALGLMSKATLVTVPFVLLLVDYWPLNRFGRRAILEKVPLLVLVVVSSIVTFIAQKTHGATEAVGGASLGLRLQNGVVSYVEYLKDSIWPAGLGVFYPFPTFVPAGRVAVAALVLAAISTIAWRTFRRAPWLTVGWCWFLGMLVPMIGVVQVGGQARADRHMYLPLIGLAIATAWSAVAAVHAALPRRQGSSTARETRMRTAIVGTIGLAVLAAFGTRTHAQVQHWRDTVALWSHTARVTEGTQNFGVYFSLGEYLRTTGRTAESLPWYEGAIERNPSYPAAHFGLGRALLTLGRTDRAATALSSAVKLDPGQADARVALGLALEELGRTVEAVDQFQEAVRLRPDVAEGHWRLGLALASAGRTGDAAAALGEASRLAPAAAAIRSDYGWALAQQGRVEDAVRVLREAVVLDQASADIRLTLARALAIAGRREEAVAEVREVLARIPDHAAAHALLRALGREP